jgi:hypothetical protein
VRITTHRPARLLALAFVLGAACADGDETPPAPPEPPGAERATEARPDDVTGPQRHVLYVLPADATDRELAMLHEVPHTLGLVADGAPSTNARAGTRRSLTT